MVEQGYDMEPSLLYQDNMSNILLKINGRASSSKQTKHIKVKYYLIKDKVDQGEITIEHCPTEQMWTDINMKPKQGAVFRAFRRHVMGIPADYNNASFATRCNFRPPSWVPEPVSMLPIPRDWVAALGYILWARYFMVEQGYDMEPSLLYQDNMSNILLKTNGRASSSKQTKHIKVKYYLIKDKVDWGEVTIEHCPTEQMWTDINTKPKQGAVFRAFRGHVMGIPADYNDASYATRCNFRPPSWVPEPVSMLPIPRDWVAAQECVGDTTKGPKPTASRPAAMVRFCCGRGGTCSANRANCGANQTGSTRTN
jgi:hypothetical protein